MLYPRIKLSEDIYWIGTNDRRTSLSENYWPLPNGVAYNSYLVLDEKVTLLDTVSMGTMDSYLEKLKEILNGRKIDYLVINHMEPDHSGAVKAIVNEYPEVKIIGNTKTFPMLEGFYGIHDNLIPVEDGSTLTTGRHTFQFFLTPMVHWPETMVTWDETDKILFG